MQENNSAEHLERRCPSCFEQGIGNYCMHCSEDMSPKRISLPIVFKSIPDIFFDVEHGLFYSIKMLLLKPGETVRRYLGGDRQRHYKPLKFVLFLGGLYAFLFVNFNIHGVSTGMYESIARNNGSSVESGKHIDLFAEQWNSVLMLIQFPIIALFTWLLFRKRKYYYGEHLLANAFFIGEVSLYNIILFPIIYLLNGTVWVDRINLLYSLWILFYYTYAFYDWLYLKKTARGFFISFGLVICLVLFIALVSLILVPVLFILKIKITGTA